MATKVKRKTLEHPFKLENGVQPEAVSPAIEVEVAAATTPLAWLTVETLLYGLIVVLAVGLRLWHLGSYPLSGVEAEQSLTALALYHGQPVEAGQYSPLLLSLNTLTFLLFGTGDAAARLAPALLGVALALLPLTLRRQLGTQVCLIASLLLAISPTTLFLSRTLNSEIGVAVGALMMAAGFFNWVEAGRRRGLWLMAGGLALLLTSGPMAYSILLVFGLIILVRWPLFKIWAGGAILRDESEQAGQETGAEQETESAADPDLRPRSADPLLRQAGIFFLAGVFLLATAATFNISGFGQIANFLVDWLGRFSLQTRPEAGFNAVFLLTVYEPLILVAGLTGLALVLLQKNSAGLVFAGWFGGTLLLDLLMGGRSNSNVILSLAPLAFLAAIALAELWAGIRQAGAWGNEGILLAAGLVIAGFGYIGLTGWLTYTCAADDPLCQYGWLQPVAALALFLVVVAFFGLLGDLASALRGAALAGVAVGLLATISIGWRLNYGPLMHLGYQPLAGIPASTELVQLVGTLTAQSEIRVDDSTLLDTTLAGLNSPALRWQLRNFKHLRQVNALSADTATAAIITPPTLSEGLDLGQAYFGQDFALDAVWSPVGLPGKTFLQWLIYRQLNERPPGNQVILWLRVEGN
ncbi:MAG: hypothetical protein AB1801_12735 [Chloroflexota bacterium]